MAWLGTWLGTSYIGTWFGDDGGVTPPSGHWISGVSHYRSRVGVVNKSHLEDGTEIQSVSRDKISGVYERWWVE